MNPNDLDFFLVYNPIDQKIIDKFKSLDIKYSFIFGEQQSKKRRFVSLQEHKEKLFYNESILHKLKRDVANSMQLDYNEYVEVRDSIGVNDAGVGIGPHVDTIENRHINFNKENTKKNKIYNDWNSLDENERYINFVQMRCNLFIIEPDEGQHAWVEDKVLEIPRGGYGAAFDSGKLHGTTPGSHKKMTISLGYLLRRSTFRELVLKNYKEEHKIYIDEKYMKGQYPN